MRKFVSLFVLAAILAFAGAAFAAESVTELNNGTETDRANGIVSSDRIISGDYGTKLFYVGEAKTNAKGDVAFGVKLDSAAIVSNGGLYSVPFGKGPNDTEAADVATYAASTVDYPKAKITLSTAIEKTANYTIGVVKDTNATAAWADSAKRVSLDIIPTKVGFDSTITVKTLKGSNGKADISADFAASNSGIVLTTLGSYYASSTGDYVLSYDKAGVATELADKTATVINGLNIAYDAAKFTITVSNDQATLAPAGTKVEFEIVAKAADEFKVTEGDVENIVVAGTAADVVLGKITIDVEKSEADLVIDKIAAKPAVSADVVKAVKAGDHSILLTVSGDTYIVNGAIPAPEALSDDYDSIDMTVAFLALDASGKLVISDDCPTSVNVMIYDSSDTEAVSFDINGGKTKMIPVIEGVAQIEISDDGAANDLYTAYVIQTPATGGSEVRGAVPAAAVTYASQAFAVLKSEPYSKSSSGACDMGFGLVAVAGLAALALRKRSK